MTEEEHQRVHEQNKRVFLLQAKIAELHKTLASITEVVYEIVQENFEKLYRKEEP